MSAQVILGMLDFQLIIGINISSSMKTFSDIYWNCIETTGQFVFLSMNMVYLSIFVGSSLIFLNKVVYFHSERSAWLY